MFFTPNFGFVSRKSTVQPVEYHPNMLEWWFWAKTFARKEEWAEGEAASARFRELHDLSCSTWGLVKNEETYSRRRKFHRKLRLGKYFLLFITETRICLGSKYLMFFTILFTKLPLYAFHYPFPIDALCLKKFQSRLDSYFSSYSVWYFSSS